MIHFEWPWIFLLFPIPWLVRRFSQMIPSERGAALKIPFSEDFRFSFHQPAFLPANTRRRFAFWLALLAWTLLLSASARPTWLGEPIPLPVSGRDLMLAVDLSGSMKAQDFMLDGAMVDRLTATKKVAGEFIKRREGDRIGLILFGTNAYLQTPLTFDRQTVATLLEESSIGLAGEDKTAIGDAIGLAVKKMRETSPESRVLILLTDGANNAGAVTPIQAARLAQSEGLKIHTIGIGADEMIVRTFFGQRRVNPSADLDEKTLIAIAKATQGRYFRARNTEALEEVYQLLDQLEPVEKENRSFRPSRALFIWPLASALFLVILLTASNSAFFSSGRVE
ncbi:MAG: VWA domain-containing protein [Magnetococcales bacterium]|nr:VWA domain-containing protein [Magnetococcales bacterium]